MKTKVTTDIYFASLLLALGAKLEKTDKDDPRHMEFHFSSPTETKTVVTTTSNLVSTATASQVTVDKLDLDALETQWVNRTCVVNAFDFAEAIKRMKSVVHSRPSYSA